MNWKATIILVLGTVGPSCLLAWLAGFAVRRLAVKWGLVDHPGHRKVHTSPTPLGGGLAIWFGVVGCFAGGQAVLAWTQSHPEWAGRLPEFVQPHLAGLQTQAGALWALLAAGTVLGVLGLLDDRRGLSWQVRLTTQFAVAIACVVGFGWKATMYLDVPLLTSALSVLWIVTLINSFNMLDNMDGLSAGVAAIAGGILATVMLIGSDPETHRPQLFVGGFLLVLIGALLGFLWHNRPPARMFMGDAGSYFIGFCLAVATLLATYTNYRGTTPHAVLAPVFVLAVPLYDLVTVLWIRIRSGRSPFEGDRNHFSHRLVDLGLTKPQAVRTIYLTTATCGLGALLLHRVDGFGAGVIALMIVCLLSIVAILEQTSRRPRPP